MGSDSTLKWCGYRGTVTSSVIKNRSYQAGVSTAPAVVLTTKALTAKDLERNKEERAAAEIRHKDALK